MSVKRLCALSAVPLALAAACAVLFLSREVEFVSSLDGLVGTSGEEIPWAIRSRSSELVPVIVSSGDAERARRTADALESAFGSVLLDGQSVAARCAEIRYRVTGDEVGRVMDFCRAHRAGLAAPAAVAELETPEGRAALARRAARKYYSSPVPPLFPAEEDPFCLLDGFVASLPTAFSGWFPKDGVLTAERDGVSHVLMLLELKESVTRELDALIRFKRTLDAAVASVDAASDVTVSACGVPLHTAISAARCRGEIGALTWFSLGFIALLALVVFRGVRWIPLLALSLATSVAAGFAALAAFFGTVHLITVVIGTTVLGLVIDYSFHWLLAADADRRGTVRNLLVSFATTEISLAPLMLSSIVVLRQSAVFLGAGLAAALAYVVWCYPRTVPEVGRDRSRAPGVTWVRVGLLALALVAVVGLCSARFGTELTAVYRPPSELAAPERLFAELSGTADGERGFVVTEGGDLERLLEKESSLGLAAGISCLSRFLPPLAARRAIAANVAKLYAEQGGRQAKLLGTDALTPPGEPEAWTFAALPDALRRPFVAARDRGNPPERSVLVAAGAPRPEAALPDGTVFCQPRELIGRVLAVWTVETERRLAFALALMFVVLAVCYRRRSVAVFAPSLFALAVVGGVLGAAGVKIGLFHLLAGFLLAGMSVDYTVFLHAGKASKPALCSLLTSFAGFGALVFVSFPVVSSFGSVLGIGLPVAFAAAWATAPRAESVEKAATPLGMEILWYFYRLLGLRVLHFSAAVVGVCAWLFSSGVRRASPSVKKVVLFTRSLADKLVVMAEGRELPAVETDGSADAAELIAGVRSGHGVFVLSSHCGTVEMLIALGECSATFHAWMDIDRTSVFNRFYLRHARRPRVVIHPISEVGMETAFFAGDALERGDSLVMAGDRGKGAFRFAHALGVPVYFVACVWEGGRYRAIVRRLPDATAEMTRAYGSVLDEVRAAYPEQWFVWE